jgi:hypothetical protein
MGAVLEICDTRDDEVGVVEAASPRPGEDRAGTPVHRCSSIPLGRAPDGGSSGRNDHDKGERREAQLNLDRVVMDRNPESGTNDSRVCGDGDCGVEQRARRSALSHVQYT